MKLMRVILEDGREFYFYPNDVVNVAATDHPASCVVTIGEGNHLQKIEVSDSAAAFVKRLDQIFGHDNYGDVA